MSLTKNELDAAQALIESAETFVITAHTRPDADAIGSILALARGLRVLEKSVVVLSEDGVPDTCTWLPDVDKVQRETSDRGFDVGIICDCNSAGRCGTSGEVATSAKSLLIIDHHKPGDSDCEPTLFLGDSSSASTAELVFELLHGLSIFIDTETAELLMAGIVGDTGGFRFSNVNAQTLEFASRLVALGASPSRASREIYENRSMANTKLLGVALLAIQTELEGRLAWSQVAKEDFARFNATDADTDSIVNHVRAIKGADVGVLFRELDEKVTRVSLRSWGKVDVNAIANTFGGGGHVAAAGITIEAPLDVARPAVLAEVRKWMAS